MERSFQCPQCKRKWRIKSEWDVAHCKQCGVPACEINKEDENLHIELIRHTSTPVWEIADRGGISHDAELESFEQAYNRVKRFVEKGHMSTLEFADATFYVSGVSRSLLAQITRHRHASFMVKSQRYTDASEESMVVPETVSEYLSEDTDNSDKFEEWRKKTRELFEDMSDFGVPNEDARYILPIGTETEFNIKANFREWRHVIGLRGLNEEAQWEIRQLLQKVLTQLVSVAPAVFEDQYQKLKELKGV